MSIDSVAGSERTSERRATGWRLYLQPPVARMLLLGFSSGLPLVLVYGTLSFRLREAGVDLATIGFLSWVALAYGFKWAWAPLVDRMPIPWLTRRLGRRRAWLLSAQVAVAAGLVAMALVDPKVHLAWLTASALVTAFASATQDIALDAYRIESAPVDQQAALAAAYQTGYRIAMIWAGAGALWLAALASGGDTVYRHDSWSAAYLAMAASMSVGLVATALAPEARIESAPGAAPARLGLVAWLDSAVIGPFADFLQRYRWHAALVLALISVYRIPDIVMGVMANPFYHDMGFSKDEVAAVSKVYGVIMTLAGAFAGGALAPRIGIQRVLFGAAAAASASILMFAWLATRGHDLPLLVAAVSADNFVAGVAGSVFIAYLSGLTNVRYSATQYALFSSLMLLLPKFVAGFSGVAVERFGYAGFFIGAALLGLPVLLLVWLTGRYGTTAR